MKRDIVQRIKLGVIVKMAAEKGRALLRLRKNALETEDQENFNNRKLRKLIANFRAKEKKKLS